MLVVMFPHSLPVAPTLFSIYPTILAYCFPAIQSSHWEDMAASLTLIQNQDLWYKNNEY